MPTKPAGFAGVTDTQIQLNRQIMGFLEAFASVVGGTKVEKTWPGAIKEWVVVESRIRIR